MPFQLWAKARFPRARFELGQWPSVARIDELSGVLALLTQHVGYTVIAEHCVAELIAKKKVALVDGPTVENQIYFATVANNPLTARVEAVMAAFRSIA